MATENEFKKYLQDSCMSAECVYARESLVNYEHRAVSEHLITLYSI